MSFFALMLFPMSCGPSQVLTVEHPLTDRLAPDFVGSEVVTGAVVTTKTERQSVRLYFFVATWCGSCGRAWENIDVLRDKYAARGLIVVGIAEASGGAEIKRECKLLETTTPIVNDIGMSIAGKWRVSVLPSLFVVDRTGIIRYVHTGYRDGDIVEVESEVEQLLGRDDHLAGE